MTEQRESWITLAKAVALILVIFIHSTPRDVVSGFLTGFVMPAFFVLYGVAHNNRKCRSNLKEYLSNRGRALMIPYIVLSLVMLVMYFLVYPTVDLGFPPSDFVFWLIYGNGPLGRVTHLWFLRTMFFAIVLFSLLDRFLYNRPAILRLFILAISPAIGVMLKFGTGVELVPWGLDAVFISLSFIMIGSEIRRYRHLSPWSVNPLVDFTGLVSTFTVYTILSLSNNFVNIGESTYGSFIYSYMITGVLGTYILCLLSYYACMGFPFIARYATKFNNLGQEIYETHPLIIEFNVQVLGGLAIWETLVLYPGAPLVILNFPLSLIISYLFASKIISRSGGLQLMFLGFRKPLEIHPKQTFPVPEPNGNRGVECINEEELIAKSVDEEELIVEYIPRNQTLEE
ncbi:acyltransferase [Candidatus Thorarchaeota archaeon]|nr:MAG: acyltransferase [Candidatus Thorarchaeota archaeon]